MCFCACEMSTYMLIFSLDHVHTQHSALTPDFCHHDNTRAVSRYIRNKVTGVTNSKSNLYI